MKRRFYCPTDAKKEYVAEVLAGYRIEVVARRHGIVPSTLSRWVRQYQDEVDDIMARRRNEEQRIKEAAEKFPELEKKLEQATKLLGEKELEIQILRDLVKKNNPHWKSPSSGSIKGTK